MDNVATKAHINRQGGMRSRPLMAEAEALSRWAEHHIESIRAEHILGVDNTQADWLSRTIIYNLEWRLHPDLFHQLSQRFGLPVINLFASQENMQLPRFFSQFCCPRAEGTNILHCRWSQGIIRLSPLLLLPQVVCKIITGRRRKSSWWLRIGPGDPGTPTLSASR